MRSVVIPAIMHLIVPSNWAMPVWLDRILSNLSNGSDDELLLPDQESRPATDDRIPRRERVRSDPQSGRLHVVQCASDARCFRDAR